MPRLPNLFGPKAGTPMRIEKPLVIMFQAPDKSVVCHIHPVDGFGHEEYGLLVCDLVRHVAGAFKVDEAAVWEWVDKERHDPTDQVTPAS